MKIDFHGSIAKETLAAQPETASLAFGAKMCEMDVVMTSLRGGGRSTADNFWNVLLRVWSCTCAATEVCKKL